MKTIVNKTWGYELWWANVREGDICYCGKQIFVNFEDWSSKGAYHYHNEKDETFFVVDGYLQLDWADLENNFHTEILGPEDSFRVKPGIKHRFKSAVVGGCKFIESSSYHSEDDSFRCRWDEEKEEWFEVPATPVG